MVTDLIIFVFVAVGRRPSAFEGSNATVVSNTNNHSHLTSRPSPRAVDELPSYATNSSSST